ncbi:MAG TPA: asparaginase [Bauldia sp.]|nr:asparaginase [Bauldia sp.]
MTAAPVLVEVTRGGVVESFHRGAVAIVDSDGRLVTAIGDVARRVFPRSAVKPIQQLPLLESGAADRYGFGPAEIALACSSHSGEPRHVATARKMLAAAGRSEADLECGGHPPTDRAAADALVRAAEHWGRIHDNCSGKHAGFVCLSCAMGVTPRGYVRPDHPVQRAITAALAEVTGAELGEPAVDGCSIPAYAIPLRNLALGFARLVTGTGLEPARAAAARRIVAAYFAEPFMIAGTGRFDTEILTRFRDRAFIKHGAEGVICAAFPETGLGVAIKCDDGAGRAPEVVMATVIETLLPGEETKAGLGNYRRPPILDRNGAKVGELRPVDGLAEMLGAALEPY